MTRRLRRSVVVLTLSVVLSLQALGQTATGTSISGLVIDPQRGVVAAASVTLRDKATNHEVVVVTNEEGRYLFANVGTGLYDIAVSAPGFKKATITDLKADVTKAVTQDITLEPGAVAETITVAAGAEAQLQKQDATLGNTFEKRRLAALPNIARDATRLLSLQPGITPDGAITGARQDQTTYSLDGIDVSDGVIGTTFRTVVPSPTEGIEEFRVTVANPNATFGRSSGAQVVFVTKRGGNSFHGSAYEYHQNDNLNANSWTNNRLGVKRGPLIDNRFGFTVGGPIIPEKTFFFGLYEGRRNLGSTGATRLVPTTTLKQGLLRFPDSTGAVRTIDPRTIDPRGLGASPVIRDLFALYPDANDFTVGDGLNTAGFTTNLPTPLRGDQGIFRLDHNFTDKWHFDGSFNYFRQISNQVGQADLVNRRAGTIVPSYPRSLSSALTGLLTSHMTNEFRFGWVHDQSFTNVINPFPQVSGTNVALELAGTPANGGFLDEPIDVDTQRARTQGTVTDTFQFIDNLTWSKGLHTVQAGFNVRRINMFHLRNDKVIGSISTPVVQIGSSLFNTIPSSQIPQSVLPQDQGRFNQLYAALLGQVENLTYLAARDGSLNQLPIGTPLIADSKLTAYEIFAADTWRITPSLTFSYGLMYTWQVPPVEARGQQTIVLNNDTRELLNPKQYLRQKFEAAAEGRIFNPTLAYLPINESGRKYAFNIDRKNFSPRVAAAWTPSFSGGVMGRLFGDRKTVLRGGYSLLYDRINTVQTVIIPTLGVGFAQTLESGALKNGTGQPFRVGVDGQLPVPTLAPTTSPIVPLQNTPAEVLSFVVDPFITVPRNHTLDFTLQRELPNSLILEVGYVGRLGRNLYQSINLNQVPFNFKDPRSGQTFAQAFDLLADQLRAGVPAAQVTSQPWFENLLVNLPPAGGSRTAALAARQNANLINGNMSNLFVALNGFAGLAFINPQARELFFRTSGGSSNYHGAFFTVRKRFAGGVAFDANYTFSRSLDQVGLVQNAAGLVPNSFNLDAEYAPSNFDITHIFNSNFVYELPFGKGRRFADTSNSMLSRLVSGWTTSGILRAASGFPLTIVQGVQVWGGSQLLGINSGAIGLSNADFKTGLFDGVKGSGNTGTSGNPANRGSGLNIFSDPEAVFKSVRRVHLSEDGRSGRNALKGLGTWQFDFALSKETKITEQVRFSLSVEFINFLNHVNFADPTVSLQGQATFGVISAQRIDNTATASQGGFTPRRIQIGARIDF